MEGRDQTEEKAPVTPEGNGVRGPRAGTPFTPPLPPVAFPRGASTCAGFRGRQEEADGAEARVWRKAPRGRGRGAQLWPHFFPRGLLSDLCGDRMWVLKGARIPHFPLLNLQPKTPGGGDGGLLFGNNKQIIRRLNANESDNSYLTP